MELFEEAKQKWESRDDWSLADRDAERRFFYQSGEEGLRAKLKAERKKNIDLAFRLQDWHDSAQKAWKTPCADEQHCSCVPLLRKKCDELQSELEAERMEYEAYRETSIVEAEHLRAELEKLKRQWAEDDRDITELEDENNQLRTELAAEREKVSALEIKVNNQQDWLVEWRKCEEALEGRA